MMMADTSALQQQQQREHPKWVEARVKYLARNSGEDESSLSSAAYHASEAGTRDGGTHEGNYEYHNKKIYNARASPSVFDIDKQGFQLVTHPTNVQDFYCILEITTRLASLLKHNFKIYCTGNIISN